MMVGSQRFPRGESELDVAGGMTRELRRQWVTSFRGSGSISATSEDELVTISPAAD